MISTKRLLNLIKALVRSGVQTDKLLGLEDYSESKEQKIATYLNVQNIWVQGLMLISNNMFKLQKKHDVNFIYLYIF